MRYLLVVFLLFLPVSTFALSVNGRLTASIHSWERQDSDSTSTARNTIHQLVSLEAKDLGIRGLSLHAYGRGFIHQEGSDTRRRLALYSTYADWKAVAHRVDLRFGRQRIFAGVGQGTFDGARAKMSLPHSVSILAYAGIGTPGDYSTQVRRWRNAHMYGLRASVRKWETTASVSFASESRRRPESLSGLGDKPVDITTLAMRLVGAEVKSRYISGAEIYGRIDVDAINWQAARWQVRGWRRMSQRLRISGEVDHRSPLLDNNSYLSVFNAKDNTELEGTIAYTFHGGFSLSGAYAVVFYTDDETQKFRATLSRGESSLSYYRRMGHGGDRDGLTVGGRRAITPKISVRGNVNFSTYRLSEIEDERDNTLAAVLGLEYASVKKLATSIEGQLIRNKTYDYDLRLFGKITWWFSIKN